MLWQYLVLTNTIDLDLIKLRNFLFLVWLLFINYCIIFRRGRSKLALRQYRLLKTFSWVHILMQVGCCNLTGWPNPSQFKLSLACVVLWSSSVYFPVKSPYSPWFIRVDSFLLNWVSEALASMFILSLFLSCTFIESQLLLRSHNSMSFSSLVLQLIMVDFFKWLMILIFFSSNEPPRYYICFYSCSLCFLRLKISCLKCMFRFTVFNPFLIEWGGMSVLASL